MEVKDEVQMKELTTPLALQQAKAHDSEGSVDEKTEMGDYMLAADDDKLNRPSVRGPFRPIRNGTIQGSIFALLTSCIATGCLNLPYRVHQLGVIPFMVVLFLTGLFSYHGMYLIEKIILRHKSQSYAEMAERAFGHKAMIFVNVLLVIYTWACGVCFEVIFMKFGVQIFADLFKWPLYENRQTEDLTATGYIVRMLIGVAMVVLSWGYMKMTDLRDVLNTAGKLSIIGVFSCIGLIYLTALFGFHRYFMDGEVEFKSILTMDYSQVEWFKPLTSGYWDAFVQATASIYFTYLNHIYVFPLISHLKRPTRKRVERIFIWAHIQEFLIYGLLGLLGYLLLSQHLDILPVSDLILASIPTAFINIGKITITIALYYRLPLMFFTTKEFIYEIMNIDRNQHHLQQLNIIICSSSLIVAIIFRGVNAYFALLGGTFGVALGGIIPTLCVLKLIRLKDKIKAVLVFCGVMSLICLVGAVQSVLSPASQ